MITLDLKSETPIYTQLRNQIILAIARGDVELGESMPTVRQLAEDLGINPMTVSKSYGELKQLGYLETNLRQGATVCTGIIKKPDFWDKNQEPLELLIAEALLSGIAKEEFLEKANTLFAQFKEDLK